MLFVASLKKQWLTPEKNSTADNDLLEQIHHIRSELPAITHVDNSARLQTVNANSNPRYHSLLCEFEKLTGFPVLINTSFNVRGEPIVCSPEDAWKCFMTTDMDYLVIGNLLLDKKQQASIDIEKLRPEKLIMD
jgi:carbamoyltransferase